MGRATPLWGWATALFLAWGALAARIPEPVAGSIRAEAHGLEVELDPERMCARELRQLPGVGPRLAQAVVATRAARPGQRIEWEDVPGIGEGRALAIRAWFRGRGIEPDPLAPGAGGRRGEPSYARAMRALAPRLLWATALLVSGCGESVRAPGEGDPKVGTSAPGVADVTARALLGGSLHALEAGPRGGEWVLLLHGARFSADTWRELGTLALLGSAGYHALALDWPGYGASPAWGVEPSAGEVLARVCDELGAACVVLIAPSLGGRFALEFAGRSPARVKGLVAIAPAGLDDRFEHGFEERFEDWSVPTLLVWGEADSVVPLTAGRALAERLPGARLEVFPGASHPCYLDAPQRFHALLLEFLATTPGPSDRPR